MGDKHEKFEEWNSKKKKKKTSKKLPVTTDQFWIDAELLIK